MQIAEGTVGSWWPLLVAAGLWVGCSPRTEIGDAEPEGVAGANDGGNVGDSTLGGSDSGRAGSPASAGFGGKGGSAGGTSSAGGTGGGAGGMGGGAGAGAGGTGGDPNKIMLFDGSPESFDNWYSVNGGMNSRNPWTYNDDGTMTVRNGGGNILSKMTFTNVFVHVEYSSPKFDYPAGTDTQQRGNSGVFLHGSYELEIIDSFGLAAAKNTCGAIYTISAPLISACKMGGEWNAYDIEFKASVCTNGVKTTNATFVEVKLNGVLIQQNVEVPHETQAGRPETCDPRGVMLEDRSTFTPVSFRNIWAIPRD